MKGGRTIYDDRDPRELGAYSIPEASHYLRIPVATLRYWVLGRAYSTKHGQSLIQPVSALADGGDRLLSFMQLVELHVLSALRRVHAVPLQQVRRALTYLKKEFPSRYPLADHNFETDGLSLFVNKYGQLINISREGQLEMQRLIEAHLRRVEYAEGLAVRLYPFTRKAVTDEPRAVVIDPFIAFGRPVLVGTGIPTAIIAERYKAGESIGELVTDYGRAQADIEEALRCELQVKAA